MNKNLEILLGLYKSIYINFKYLKLKEAIRLPIFVSRRTKFLKLKGKIIINNRIKTGMIKIGIVGAGTNTYKETVIENNGTIIFNGNASFGGGTRLCTVNTSSNIVFGKDFDCTGDTLIVSKKKISFGDNCLLSWKCQLMDTDFHKIIALNTEKQLNKDEEITIKDNVWITSGVTILKGSVISKNTIIAANSTIFDKFDKENIIIGGTPGKIVKDKVSWKK